MIPESAPATSKITTGGLTVKNTWEIDTEVHLHYSEFGSDIGALMEWVGSSTRGGKEAYITIVTRESRERLPLILSD